MISDSKKREKINLAKDLMELVYSEVNEEYKNKNFHGFNLVNLNKHIDKEEYAKIIINGFNNCINALDDIAFNVSDSPLNKKEDKKTKKQVKDMSKKAIRELYDSYEVTATCENYNDPFLFTGKLIRNISKHQTSFDVKYYTINFLCFAILIWLRANFNVSERLYKQEEELISLICKEEERSSNASMIMLLKDRMLALLNGETDMNNKTKTYKIVIELGKRQVKLNRGTIYSVFSSYLFDCKCIYPFKYDDKTIFAYDSLSLILIKKEIKKELKKK